MSAPHIENTESNITPNYARHASKKFNLRLHKVLQRLAKDVKKALEDNLLALILGGGYGRGEGGMVEIDGAECPYNDLDFTIVLKNKRLSELSSLSEISEKYQREIKIHVDFSKPLNLKDIQNWPSWLMWYDLLNGHVVLSGDKNILTNNAPESIKQPLPLIEATRLLLNRGAGILWARRMSENLEPLEDDDFVRRNYYKCLLALGDALLISYKRYTTQYHGRDKLLNNLVKDFPELADFHLQPLYEKALVFKFSPDKVSNVSLGIKELKEVSELWGNIFLLVESLRARRKWKSLSEYIQHKGLREPELNMPFQLPFNIIRNIRIGIFSTKYPREDLYRQLPVLLGLTESRSPNWAKDSSDFLKVWNKFN